MRKVVISTIVGFASGVVVSLAFQDDFTHEKEANSQHMCANETTQVVAYTAYDVDEINHLKEKIAKLESNRGSLSKPVQENIDSQSLDCGAAIHSAMQAADKKNELINEFQKMTSPENYDLQLQQTFADEELNPIWASDTESELYNALKIDPSTQAIAVSMVKCKAKTCEITVPANDSTRNEIVDAISNYSFLTLSGFKNPSTKSTLTITNGEVKIYVSNHP